MTIPFPERLETRRLLLSRPEEADLPDLTAMHTDPRVMATLGGLRTTDELEAMHRRLFACWERDGFGWWVARHRPDGRFAGRGGLRRVHVGGREEVEVGYGLVADLWGQGLATGGGSRGSAVDPGSRRIGQHGSRSRYPLCQLPAPASAGRCPDGDRC